MTSGRLARGALALALASTCGHSKPVHETAAGKLERLVAEQRAQPVQKPTVADRHDVAPVVTERWRWQTPDGGNVGLAATDGRGVVATHTQRYLVALDVTGAQQWSVEHVGLRPVEPLLAGDLVVAAAEDDVLAVDRASGAIRWTAPIGHERANAPALADDTTVVVSTWEGRLLALDRGSGAVRWSVALDGESLWRPVAVDGIVVAAWDGGWGAFGLADGRVRWKAELWPDDTGSPVIVSSPHAAPAAVVASGGRIDANDLRTGAERWRTTIWVGTAADQAIAAPPTSPATVIVPDRAGGVTVLDAASGDLAWFFEGAKADLAERGGPALLDDGLVAYALDVGGMRLAWAGGHLDVDPGAPVAGVARLGDGLVATTWQGEAPGIVLFDVRAGHPSR